MSFFDSLHQASIGGINFGVLSAGGRFGRRQAVHEYPFRDRPWVEDIGKSARRISITGFLVENDIVTSGGDATAQRDALIGVCEDPGTKTLVHPTLGILRISIMELSVFEKWDRGRYFEFQISFIEAGERVFPTSVDNTSLKVEESAITAKLKIAASFAQQIVKSVHWVTGTIHNVLYTARTWVGIANSLAYDAANAIHAVFSMPGDFGRILSDLNLSALSPSAIFDNIESAISSSATAQDDIRRRGDMVVTSISSGNVSAITDSVQSLTDSFIDSTVYPGDSTRYLSAMSRLDTPTKDEADLLFANLFRRASVVSLAQSSARYQPVSADDANATMTMVINLIDIEINIAGDSGEDDVFVSLRELRSNVVADLNRKGASLPEMKNFEFNASLPASSIALMIYRDAGRENEIVSETGAPHPAFQPYSMRLLSS